MADLSHAQQIISSGLAFLMPLGFREPSIRIEESRLLGDSLLMEYVSETTQRRIEVNFAPSTRGRLAAVSMFICNKSGERFSVEDWVTDNVPNSRVRFLADQPFESEQFFLDRFCVECRQIFEGPLRDTVAGKEWAAVALNWKGYC